MKTRKEKIVTNNRIRKATTKLPPLRKVDAGKRKKNKSKKKIVTATTSNKKKSTKKSLINSTIEKKVVKRKSSIAQSKVEKKVPLMETNEKNNNNTLNRNDRGGRKKNAAAAAVTTTKTSDVNENMPDLRITRSVNIKIANNSTVNQLPPLNDFTPTIDLKTFKEEDLKNVSENPEPLILEEEETAVNGAFTENYNCEINIDIDENSIASTSKSPSPSPENVNCNSDKDLDTVVETSETGLVLSNMEMNNGSEYDLDTIVNIEENLHLYLAHIEMAIKAMSSNENLTNPNLLDTTFDTTFSSPINVGDLFWGKIFDSIFWPCIVYPDALQKEAIRIVTDDADVNQKQCIEVHVRYLAYSGLRGCWLKPNTLIPFSGSNNHVQTLKYIRDKYTNIGEKYKLLLPTRQDITIWHAAIQEADFIGAGQDGERLNRYRELKNNILCRKRGKRKHYDLFEASANISLNSIESYLNDNNNIIEGGGTERSDSPCSPAFSPIKRSKRRRLNSNGSMISLSDQETQDEEVPRLGADTDSMTLAQVQQDEAPNDDDDAPPMVDVPPANDFQMNDNKDFKRFLNMINDFALCGDHNEEWEAKLKEASQTIWKVKCMSAVENHRTDNSVRNLSARMKRFSMRLTSTKLALPQSQQLVKNYTPPKTTKSNSIVNENQTKEQPKTAEKNKKQLEEVINDIFQLGGKYLFRGLARGSVCRYCFQPGKNMLKCSKNCDTFFHMECKDKRSENINHSRTEFTAAAIKDRRKSAHSSIVKKSFRRLSVTSSAELELIRNNSAVKELNSESDNDIDDDDEEEEEDEKSSTTSSSLATTANLIDSAICWECENNEKPKCVICKSSETILNKDGKLEELICCTTHKCLQHFHESCCKYWPQAQFIKSKSTIESFRCPSHVCHICVSDDPRTKFHRTKQSKLIRCIKCPATYHTDASCVPAGSKLLTASWLICPRHFISKADKKINVNWCFICVKGGSVICCETCPIAVHAECLNMGLRTDEAYICDECESGRMPLYGEMVWAKFHAYRWWPAIILPPTEIPENILRKPHNLTEFAVRFFGSHDHGWISRRRVYLFCEGDGTQPPNTRTNLNKAYTLGVQEAMKYFEIIKLKRTDNVEKLYKNFWQPLPYIKIKTNRIIPPVRLQKEEKINKCACNENEEHPCSSTEKCLNRMILHECNPKSCSAGTRCENQEFEKKIYPPLETVYLQERGFGLICKTPIQAGTFIIEYVGEVINDEEFHRRLSQKFQNRDENFYFLSVEKDYIIDAGPKGNLARFINHSCSPNCETQKWNVNGIHRIGIFALHDIPANTELTFNYHWDDLFGKEKKVCYCGAKNCSGQIGGIKTKDGEGNQIADKQSLDALKNNNRKQKQKLKIHVKSKPKTLSKKLTLRRPTTTTTTMTAASHSHNNEINTATATSTNATTTTTTTTTITKTVAENGNNEVQKNNNNLIVNKNDGKEKATELND